MILAHLLTAALSCTSLAGARTEPIAEIRSEVERALQMRSIGQAGHSELLRRCAFQFNRFGAPSEALGALDHVLSDPESEFDRLEALRMKGQYLNALGDGPSGGLALAEQIAAYEQDPALIDRFSSLYASGIFSFQAVRAQEGRFAEAIELNERILEREEKFATEVVQSAWLNKVHLLARSNELGAAVQLLDQFFERFPTFGQADGGWVPLRLSRAQYANPARHSADYRWELSQLWGAPGSDSTPESISVGLELAGSLRRFGDDLAALNMYALVLQRIDVKRLAWLSSHPESGHRISEGELTVLGSLQAAHKSGRHDLAIMALTRLMAKPGITPQEFQSYQSQLVSVLSPP
jgi:tetratricopeptide (TPR) repeat protein